MIGQQALTPDDDGVAVDDASHAFAAYVGEVLGRGQGAEFCPGGLGDRLCDGMLGGVLQGSDIAQQRFAVGRAAR